MTSNQYFYNSLCQLHEEKGRSIAANCIREALYPYPVNLSCAELTSSVDLQGYVYKDNCSFDFNVEVKERRKNQDILKRFPDCELRVDKYKRMLSETPEGTELLYVVLLNESKCYIFNLTRLDWSKVSIKDWEIKRIQVASNSDYKSYQIYQIPTDLAWATIDCSKYYNQYRNQN